MRECCICICVYCYRLPSRSHGATSNTISSIIINDYQRQDGLGVLYTPIKLDPSTNINNKVFIFPIFILTNYLLTLLFRDFTLPLTLINPSFPRFHSSFYIRLIH